jgi:hypothetical protein
MAKSVCKATKILNLDFVNSDNSLPTINQQDLIASALNLSRYEQGLTCESKRNKT